MLNFHCAWTMLGPERTSITFKYSTKGKCILGPAPLLAEQLKEVSEPYFPICGDVTQTKKQ